LQVDCLKLTVKKQNFEIKKKIPFLNADVLFILPWSNRVQESDITF